MNLAAGIAGIFIMQKAGEADRFLSALQDVDIIRKKEKLNQWESLIYYLKDGRIPATNNIAEREGIKPFVMARKNFLFADTIEGAKATSMWFSLIISARMNHLDAEKYLIYVLDQLSASETITEKLIERCLPYSNQLPVNLKM